jgi:superfamily II DNA or RNA helicase
MGFNYETDADRRKKRQQSQFNQPDQGPRQNRLTVGDVTVGGILYVPPSERAKLRGESKPRSLNVPGPRLAEFGEEGQGREAPKAVPPPPVRTVEVVRQQTLTGEEPEKPTEFVVRPIPLDVVQLWKPPFPLRKYQEEAVHEFHQRHKGRVVYATGTGKTAIAISIINDLRVPAVVIVPTLMLVDQWVAAMATWGIKAGVWTGDRHDPTYVTLATYQSLYTDPTLVRRFPLIIFDEVHRATAKEFSDLIVESQHHPYAFALTATDPSEAQRANMLDEYLPILKELSPADAIAAGYLTPVNIVPKPVALSGEESKEYERIVKVLTYRAQRMGTGDPVKVARMMSSVEFHDDAVAFLRALAARRKLLSGVVSKRQALVDIVNANPRQRILLFSESVPAVLEQCEFLREAGIGCHTISGQTDSKVRRSLLASWGKTFMVLGSVHVLQEGFDVPEVSTAVFVASGTGKLQLTQRLGRILRLAPGKSSATAYVLFAMGTVETEVLSKLEKLAGQHSTVPEGTHQLTEWDQAES